jgi:hypothetical protein
MPKAWASPEKRSAAMQIQVKLELRIGSVLAATGWAWIKESIG